MTAVIGHNYSELDHQHEFFIVCNETWLWFHLGAKLQKAGIKEAPKKLLITPYPFEPSISETISFSDCEKGAEKIVTFIRKNLRKPKKEKINV